MGFCGVDLAGNENRISGICHINENVVLKSVFSDSEILNFVHEFKPRIVAIDSPLSHHGEHFRDCDREIRKKYRILPLTFKGMQKLTKRGINLKGKLSDFEVIEVYPHASKMALKIEDIKDLNKYLRVEPQNKHEFDAVVSALTAKFYFEGRYKIYGKRDKIVVPRL